MDEAKSILKVLVSAAEDKKAGDLEVISVKGLTTLSDYFMILTGTSTPHVKALADEMEKAAKEKLDLLPHHVEGYNAGNWILLDFGHVLVHIFLAETRRFYSLERLWGDAPKIDLTEFRPDGPAEKK